MKSQENEGGRALAAAIAATGTTAAQVERELGVSSGVATRLIQGKRKPGRVLARELREKLGIDEGLWDVAVPVKAKKRPPRTGTDG